MSPLAWLLKGLVLAYRYSFSAFLGRSCRFQPTCSEYAVDAIEAHGAIKGGFLAVRRIARCHPWGGEGHDPVPPVDAARGPAPGHRRQEPPDAAAPDRSAP